MFETLLPKLLIIPAILIGISIHEYGHALAAVKLGDDTPLHQGRLSLNPIKHLDPLGFLFLLVVGFGWAKPVMINPRNFKNPRRDDIIVSIAGVTLNFITAIVFVLIIKFMVNNFFSFLITDTGNVLLTMLYAVVQINIVLMIFNLLPIPPLDGHHIAQSVGGFRVYNFFRKYEQVIRIGLIILLVTGYIGRIIGPPVYGITNFLFSVFNVF
jgi:Zn-dependent protease